MLALSFKALFVCLIIALHMGTVATSRFLHGSNGVVQWDSSNLTDSSTNSSTSTNSSNTTDLPPCKNWTDSSYNESYNGSFNGSLNGSSFNSSDLKRLPCANVTDNSTETDSMISIASYEPGSMLPFGTSCSLECDGCYEQNLERQRVYTALGNSVTLHAVSLDKSYFGASKLRIIVKYWAPGTDEQDAKVIYDSTNTDCVKASIAAPAAFPCVKFIVEASCTRGGACPSQFGATVNKIGNTCRKTGPSPLVTKKNIHGEEYKYYDLVTDSDTPLARNSPDECLPEADEYDGGCCNNYIKCRNQTCANSAGYTYNCKNGWAECNCGHSLGTPEQQMQVLSQVPDVTGPPPAEVLHVLERQLLSHYMTLGKGMSEDSAKATIARCTVGNDNYITGTWKVAGVVDPACRDPCLNSFRVWLFRGGSCNLALLAPTSGMNETSDSSLYVPPNKQWGPLWQRSGCGGVVGTVSYTAGGPNGTWAEINGFHRRAAGPGEESVKGILIKFKAVRAGDYDITMVNATVEDGCGLTYRASSGLNRPLSGVGMAQVSRVLVVVSFVAVVLFL